MSSAGIYAAVNEPVLQHIPPNARRVLDIGCGTGAFAKELKKRQSVEVVGITFSAAEAALAAANMDAVHQQDLNAFGFQDIGKFDCAVLSHVLEHLHDPVAVLGRLKQALSSDATAIVALPNVLAWRQRLQFIAGRFRYQDFGTMDRTHVRFFDHITAAELIGESGYELIRRADVGHFPQPGFRRILPALSRSMDNAMTRFRPGLFADQFILIARPRAI